MKKEAQRIFAALLSVVLTLSLCPWALAEYATDTRTDLEEDYAGKTVILHSNDVHGAIMGYAYIAALRTEFEGKGAEVILADAGDFSQGDVSVSHSKGADAVLMMNEAGYDVATLGNHEFDYGYEQLVTNLKAANFKIVCADIFEGGKLVWEPNWMYESKSGLKIGFFGLDTPDTATQANPAMTRGLTFLDKEPLYECAREQAAALRGEGADIVVALTHLGVNEGSESRSDDLFRSVQGIDLMIDGHSHTVMTAGGNSEPVQSTGTKFAYVGVVVIDNEKKAVEDHYLIPTKQTETVEENGESVEKTVFELAKDPNVAVKAQEIIDRVDAVYGEKFAESEIYLVGDDDVRSVRTKETNMGDLITDAIVWKVLKENADVLSVEDGNGQTWSVDHSRVVGVTNGGGIRTSLKAGDLTRKDLNTVLPFGNTVAVVFVSGAELLEALEASTYCTPEPLGGYPQTFGIEFTLDTTKAYDKGENYSSSYYKPASIQRVNITKINGEPFDPNAIYAVVTNDFLSAGGDTYYSFKEARAQFDTGIPMDEAVMEYVDVNLKNVVSAEPYGEPRGDQKIILANEGGESGQGEQGGESGQGEQGGESGQSKSGCYVATSVYGSYDCPQVWTLRRFRDNVLAETWYGRLFVRAYYAVSPAAVELFGDCEWFRAFFRDKLDALVSGLQADGFEATPYQDKDW